MTEEQKIRLKWLIEQLVISNRNDVHEEMRWDGTRSGMKACQDDINKDEEALDDFIKEL